VPIVRCPKCRKRYDPGMDDELDDLPDGASLKVVCAACGQWLRLPEKEAIPAPATSKSMIKKMMAQSRLVDEDDDDRPARRCHADEEDDERPSRRRRTDDDEDDERPTQRRRRAEDDDDDDRPPRRRREAADDDDERPPRRVSSRPKKKKRRQTSSGVSGRDATFGILFIVLGGFSFLGGLLQDDLRKKCGGLLFGGLLIASGVKYFMRR
jgi:hypothetical protein